MLGARLQHCKAKVMILNHWLSVKSMSHLISLHLFLFFLSLSMLTHVLNAVYRNAFSYIMTFLSRAVLISCCTVVLGIWVRKCPFREFLDNHARPSLQVGYRYLESPKKSLPLKLPENISKSATPFYLYFQPGAKTAQKP